MKVFEIEKKVLLTPYQLKKLSQKAHLIKESVIQDSYFDSSNYRLTLQNIWLRDRQGSFELKVGIKKHNGTIDRYEEITDEQSIIKHLKGSIGDSLTELLSHQGLLPFCTFITRRKTFQLDDLKIDVDDADFGDLHYQVAEIEAIVSDLTHIQEAEEKIARFIQKMKIDATQTVPAKLSYYLYHQRPHHYEALVFNRIILPINT